jgi:hypothetical protein
MTLFERSHVVGVFRGFSEGGMEFHADIVMPYRDEFQAIPMHGQFVLVELEHEHEAVFGRITSIASQGRLTSPVGEDYAVRAVRDQRPIPDELRDRGMSVVEQALNEIFGKNGWKKEHREYKGKSLVWVTVVNLAATSIQIPGDELPLLLVVPERGPAGRAEVIRRRLRRR